MGQFYLRRAGQMPPKGSWLVLDGNMGFYNLLDLISLLSQLELQNNISILLNILKGELQK